MKKAIAAAVLMLSVFVAPIASADPFDDAIAAYEKGDYATALKLYTPLAEQGDASAQYNLGLMYTNGQGVPQNYTEAAKWYRLAAKQGLASAQNNLGASYFFGDGVPQNYVKAHMWINLAASHATGDNNKKYSDTRNQVAAKMTPAQIAEAQALAAKCQSSNYKNCD